MVENSSVITFKLMKKKRWGLRFMTVFSLLAGILCLWHSPVLTFGRGRFFLLVIGVSLLLIFIFCIASIYLLNKEKNAAMYISDEGIMDISTGNQIGTVLWQDVETIKIMDDISDLKHKYIVLKVRIPKEYIDREKTGIKRRSLELRLQYYGSPICFSDRALDCSFEELKEAVFGKYNSYKERTANS